MGVRKRVRLKTAEALLEKTVCAHKPNQQAKTEGQNKPRKLALSALAAPYDYLILIRMGTEFDPFADRSSAISICHQQVLAPGAKPA